jgi:uncharacterized damage-inducible protein DinB
VNAHEIRHLFEYAHWVTRKVLSAAARVPNDEFAADRPVPPDGRGLRSTLVHELDAETSWRQSLQGAPAEELRDMNPADYGNIEQLDADFSREQVEMSSWLESLTDDELAAEVTPSISGHPRPLWQYLLHVLFHATQQNADAALLLSAAGVSPGGIDYGTWIQSTEDVPG